MPSKKKHDDLGKQVWVTSGKMEHVAYLIHQQEHHHQEEVEPGKVLIQWQDGGRVYVDAAAILGDLHPDASASIADEERQRKTPRRNRRRSQSKKYIEKDTDDGDDADDEHEKEQGHQDTEGDDDDDEEEEAKKPASRPSKRRLPATTRDSTFPTEILVSVDTMDGFELSLSGDEGESVYHGPKLPFEQPKVRKRKHPKSGGEHKAKNPPDNDTKRSRNITSRYESNSNPARISLGKGQRTTYSQVDRLRRASVEAKLAQNEAPSNDSDTLSFGESPIQKPSQPTVAVVTTVKKKKVTSAEEEIVHASVQDIDVASTPGHQNHVDGVNKVTTVKAARPGRRILTLPQRTKKVSVTECDDQTKTTTKAMSATASADSIKERLPNEGDINTEDKSSDCASLSECPELPARLIVPVSLNEPTQCQTGQSSGQQKALSSSVPPSTKMLEHEATTSTQTEAVPSNSHQSHVMVDGTAKDSALSKEVLVESPPKETSAQQLDAANTETPVTPNRPLAVPRATKATPNAPQIQKSSPRAPEEASTPFYTSLSAATPIVPNSLTVTTRANTEEAATPLQTSTSAAMSKLKKLLQSSTPPNTPTGTPGANDSAASSAGPLLNSSVPSKSTPTSTMAHQNITTCAPNSSHVAQMLDIAPGPKLTRTPTPEALPTMAQTTVTKKAKSQQDAPALERTMPQDSCGTATEIASDNTKAPKSSVTASSMKRKSPKRIRMEQNKGRLTALVVVRPPPSHSPPIAEKGMVATEINTPATNSTIAIGDKAVQMQSVRATQIPKEVDDANQQAPIYQGEVISSDNESVSEASPANSAKSMDEAPTHRTQHTVSNRGDPYELARSFLETADTTTITANQIITDVEDHLDQELSWPLRRNLKKFIHDRLAIMKSNTTSTQNSLNIFLEEGIECARSTINSNFHNKYITAVSLIADSASTTSFADSTAIFSGIAALANLQEVTISYCGNSLNICHLMKQFSRSSIRKLKLLDAVLAGGNEDNLSDSNLHSLRVLHLVGCAPSEGSNPMAFQTCLSRLTASAPLTELWLDSNKGLSAHDIEKFCRTFQRFELGLRCMPVPDNILGYNSLTKLRLIDCAYTCTGNALVSSTQVVQKELFVWGRVSQEKAVSFFQKIKINQNLEVMTLTISGGADANALGLDQLLVYNDKLRKVDLVILGRVRNASQAAVRVLESLETNASIRSLRIFVSKKDCIDQHQQSVRKQLAKTIRANRTIQKVHLFGLEWHRTGGY